MPKQMYLNLSEDKKNKIFNAAIEEFSERNLQEAKVALIMKRAEISRASFYNYFEDTGDLYLYVIIKLRENRFEYLKQHMVYENDTFFEYFRSLYLCSVDFLLDNHHYIKISKHLWASEDPISKSLTDSLHRIYLETFSQKIEHDKTRGIIRQEVNTLVVAELFSQLSTTVFVHELRVEEVDKHQYAKKVDQIIDMLSFGICHPPQ